MQIASQFALVLAGKLLYDKGMNMKDAIISITGIQNDPNGERDSVELVIVPGADHCNLYDQMDKIPFDVLERFFEDNL